MSQENVELMRRGYAAVSAAYKSGDFDELRSLGHDYWSQDVVLRGAVMAGGEEWHGTEGLVRFFASQMEAFGQMWLEPLEFIDAGDRLVAVLQIGGRARHTGIELAFPMAHVLTFRDGRMSLVDTYRSKTEALEAVDGVGKCGFRAVDLRGVGAWRLQLI